MMGGVKLQRKIEMRALQIEKYQKQNLDQEKENTKLKCLSHGGEDATIRRTISYWEIEVPILLNTIKCQ